GDRVATSTVARDPAATSIAVLQLGPRRAGAAVPDGELTFTVTFLSAGTVRCSHSTQATTGRHADTSLSVVRKDFSSKRQKSYARIGCSHVEVHKTLAGRRIRLPECFVRAGKRQLLNRRDRLFPGSGLSGVPPHSRPEPPRHGRRVQPPHLAAPGSRHPVSRLPVLLALPALYEHRRGILGRRGNPGHP